jgi:curli biogenesis system outer membrane secretion channel CsgG
MTLYRLYRCCTVALCALTITTCLSAVAEESASAKKLPTKNERVVVSIYEFRSSMPELGARGATDMFKTALLANGRFRVVERARLNEGVAREKQLNSAGQSTERSADRQLIAAEYIFEGTISEATTGEQQDQSGVNIGGLQIGGSKSAETIAIDVRIINAATGELMDAITLRRALTGSTSAISGTNALFQTLATLRGRSASPLVPDVNMQSSRKDSVDKALRGLIDESVAKLAARFVQSGNQ